MTSVLVTALIGLVIPAVVAFVTKERLPLRIKAYILLLLSTASGVLTGVVTSPPHGLSQWEHVFSNIIVTFVAAASAEYAGWRPTGVHEQIVQRSKNFGIGPPSP